MNRHDRRAQEAQARKSFEDYASAFRKAFKKVDDREIGEGWMRGAKAEADDIKGMVIHPPGEPPPPASACDISLSAAYGAQRFDAVTRSEWLPVLQSEWPRFREQLIGIPDTPVTDDIRHDARGFLFDTLMSNRQYESGMYAALAAGAIVWLARTSAIGIAIGDSHKGIHYEITDTGPTGRNFRLILT